MLNYDPDSHQNHMEASMDNQAIDILEQKLHKILAKLEELKGENKKLREKNQELQSVIQEKENTINSIRTDSERYSILQSDIESYKTKENTIRTKVESLLQKLKEFKDIQ